MEVEKRDRKKEIEVERWVKMWISRFFELAVYIGAFLTIIFLLDLQKWIQLLWVLLAVIWFVSYRSWKNAFNRLQRDYMKLLKEALEVDKKMRELEKCDTKEKATEKNKN